jgi:tight adherence protein B
MTTLLAAVAGALVVAGVIGVVAGLRPVPERPAGPYRRSPMAAQFLRMSRRTRILLGAGILLGVVVTVVTGWPIALVLTPAAVAGIPTLLMAPPTAARIDKLEALEEWTRALSGVLTVGVGLEQAIEATLRSTPPAIRPEVSTLVSRLRARMDTGAALRLFAEDLDDATGDLVAINLILGAQRRGQGLAAVLETLAESVSDDVRARRAIEADRAKPRNTARWVTIITIGVLLVLTLTGDYIAPYGTPVGQLLLASLLSTYVLLLQWMRNMAKGQPLPRFMGAKAREGVHS